MVSNQIIMPRKQKDPLFRPGMFVENVEIQRVYNKASLIKRISIIRELPYNDVEHALRYNVMTVAQFAMITGTVTNTVHQLLKGYPVKRKGRKGMRMKYALRTCQPFNRELLTKFIYRDKKAQLRIEKSVNFISE